MPLLLLLQNLRAPGAVIHRSERTRTEAATILAYGLNGRDLPRGNGAPVRLRVERHCGYKHLKFVKSIEAVASFEGIGRETGGINSDWGFHWYAGA